jgi:uncharacterized membrane protein YkoI
MKQVAIFRMLNRFGVFGVATLLTVLVGCSDNSTGPAPTDQNPPGSNASVEISDPVSQAEADSVRDNVRRNASDTLVITLDDAIIRALAQAIGAELLGVHLDYDRDELNYECVVRQNGRVYVVVIDPKNGNVKKKEELNDTAYHYPGVIVVRPIKVKVKDAQRRARELSDGDVVECNIENYDGQPTYVVVILTRENRYVTVYIDAETGKEKKVKDDGACEDTDHDGKRKKGRGHYRHGRGHGYGHRHHCHCECQDDDGDGHGGGDTTQVRDSVITKDSANTIVRGMFTDSMQIVEAKLETKNDSTAFYNYKLQRDSNHYELVLNAFTGGFVSIKQTAGNADSTEFIPAVKGDTLVKLSVARTAAIAQLAGAVQTWKLEYDAADAKWVYTFEIKPATGDNKQVVVDAKTGLFIRIKP